MPILRVDPSGPFGSRLLRLLAFLCRGAVWLYARTCRLRVVHGSLDAVKGPVLLACWHNRTILLAAFLVRHPLRRRLKLAIMASESQDGELAAHAGRGWGLHVVRGSATRGGPNALRRLYRAARFDRASPIMLPDGPSGPLYRFKEGVVVLAQMAKVPVLPIGFAARGFRGLDTWDVMMLPRPFTDITVAVGEPMLVARGADVAAARDRLEVRLEELTRAAEAAVGRESHAREHAGRTNRDRRRGKRESS